MFSGFEGGSLRAERVGKPLIPTIYLIHVNKCGKVTVTFRGKSQTGGVKKPRSSVLAYLLGSE